MGVADRSLYSERSAKLSLSETEQLYLIFPTCSSLTSRSQYFYTVFEAVEKWPSLNYFHFITIKTSLLCNCTSYSFPVDSGDMGANCYV